MELQYRKNDKTGEELYYTTHSSGLGIYIIPKKDYSKTYAIFGTRYGSVDSKFVVPGESELTEVPDGIAHYLEHKCSTSRTAVMYLINFQSTAAMQMRLHHLI